MMKMNIMLDVAEIRKNFPIINNQKKKLVYLDNAATTQKPLTVIQSITDFYTNTNSNVHRGVYSLSQDATQAYESSRGKIKEFINATFTEEIVFVRGTTEAINLVANSFVAPRLKKDDEILISAMEHHSNLLPWQILSKRSQAHLKIIPMDKKGELITHSWEELITDKTRLIALVHISNSLGTINPIKKIIDIASKNNIPVLLDGAQAVGHQKVDVQDLNCDFYTFSGHKMFGPTGIGILYAKKEHLENMDPYQYGGEMIKSVSYHDVTFNDIPYKFEGGTPNVSGAIALGHAVDYLNSIGMENVRNYTDDLLHYGTEKLQEIDDLEIIGQSEKKSSIISFIMAGIHPHDIGTILDNDGIAVRAGHHCTQPVMDFFEIPGTARASFSIYNTKSEIDYLVESLKKVKAFFA